MNNDWSFISQQPAACPGGEIYIIQPGDTFYSLARRNNIPVAELERANPGVDPLRLQVGQEICIPTGRVLPKELLYGQYYKVQPGDTLDSIAGRFGTTVQELMILNDGINSLRQLSTGQMIIVKALSIYNGPLEKRMVALTFDVEIGRTTEQTKQVLEMLKTLKEYNIKSTFFLLGEWLEEYGKDYAKQIYADGHEIGNHGYNHKDATTMNPQELIEDILGTEKLIKKYTGKTPHLYRPPGGKINQSVLNVVNSIGYQTIKWNVDPKDYELNKSAKSIEEDTLNQICEFNAYASICLFHSFSKGTADALPNIISRLSSRQITFGTVTDILRYP